MLLKSFRKQFNIALLGILFPLSLTAQKVSVSFYDLHITVIDSSQGISGNLVIHTKEETLKTIFTQLSEAFKNTSGFKDVHLSIIDTSKATIQFSGTPLVAKDPPWDGGFVWQMDDKGYPFIGVACQSDGPQIWWPAFDDIAIRPDSMAIHLTITDSLMGISNGKLMQITSHENHTKTYHWKVSYPINNYNVSIYIGHYKKVDDMLISNSEDSLQLHYYPLAQNKNLALAHFTQTKNILAVFEDLFGPYPFIKDGYKLVEAPYWGMEHQSAIAYGNHYQNNPFGFDFIILHESAHEYWGNSVTMKDFGDLWIHETMATYTEVLYVEKTQGKLQSQQYLNFQKKYIKNTHPIAGEEGQKKYATSDMYFKGSWMMHTLRSLYVSSDSSWFRMMKQLYQENKGGFIDRGQFIQFWKNEIGDHIMPFFNHYLYSHKIPVLHIKVKGKKLFYQYETTENFYPNVSLEINHKTAKLNNGNKKSGVYLFDHKIKSIDLAQGKYLIDLVEDL